MKITKTLDNIKYQYQDVGIDIIKTSRLKQNPSFIDRILSEKEKEEYFNKETKRQQIRYLATIWSCKEAIFKLNYINKFNYKNISIIHKNGKPYCLEYENIRLSVSHENKYTISIAILLKK